LIHEANPVRRPLVIVNCPAQAHELSNVDWFERVIASAPGGTLLLDEVGELPDAAQRRLLALLLAAEQQPPLPSSIDSRAVRVIATTARDLTQLVSERRLREELFYRLAALLLQLSPLRACPDRIPAYARDIVTGFARRQPMPCPGISPQALHMLNGYGWPGNIRELDNVCRSAAASTRTNEILPQDIQLPARTRQVPPAAVSGLAGRTLLDIERQAVIETLTACAGNKALTARTLGISEKSIYNKIRRHKIQL
jgi:DNA-binding NtrC family response regulator